jgi:hypothetical protein
MFATKNWHGKLDLPRRESAVYMLKSLFDQLLRDGSSREAAVYKIVAYYESIKRELKIRCIYEWINDADS